MKFLFYEVDLDSDDIIVVTLSNQANVKVMDSINFSRYKHGKKYSFHGGLAKVSPLRLASPGLGHWYVVIDLGGYAGSVEASVSVLKGS